MDEPLVEAARQGDQSAFGELVRRYQKRIYTVALGILRDPEDARDVCQEAFLRVHRAIRAFEGNSQFFTWLYRIVVNLSLDQKRKRKPECALLDNADESTFAPDATGLTPRRGGTDPHDAFQNGELRRRLLDALEGLSPSHRAVLVLREAEGLSYKEIARALRCSVGTVMSRLFYARRRMQALLVDDQPLATALAA